MVPTRTIRNSRRSGVITRMFTSRAPSVYGVISP
ncbi:Uncharacterised protein [Mycobacteroides abscessus subsp. abscessus]|nr:Uncharacterised protein [Mycobacteroides abscessus subsp. abscessus]